MKNLTAEICNTESVTNTDTWWVEIDKTRSIIHEFNRSKGLKTIMSGAWTYDKLVNNAMKVLNITFEEARQMNVDELIKQAD